MQAQSVGSEHAEVLSTPGVYFTGPRQIAKHTHTHTHTPYPNLGVEVRRSSLNTPVKKRARAGYKTRIIEAGDGLFAMRRFKPGEHILDYRYQHGVKQRGNEVDWLSTTAFIARYPPSESMPCGGATHVLHPHNSPYYFDTARTGGVGGGNKHLHRLSECNF